MKSTSRFCRIIFAALVLSIVFSADETANAQQVIFAIDSSERLLRFNSSTPGTVVTTSVTGLLVGESIFAIDFRPANGLLYALVINPSTGAARIYTINTTTAAASLVSTLSASLTNASYGMDFNPVEGFLRVVNNDMSKNIRVNVDNGNVITDIPLAYGAGDTNVGVTPNIVGLAYSNNFAGALSTTLTGIDSNLDRLVTITNPNGGTLQTGVSIGSDTGPQVGYDISSAGVSFFAFNQPGLSTSNLYTGPGFTLLGTIGGGQQIRDISAEPTVGGVQGPIISEFRVRGPNGANDEFIEIYNPSGSAHTVAAASGTGYGVAASDGTTRCSIPNGTVIPARGHYLCVNSVAYSLASYPAGNGTTATGDATYTTDIPDNAGIALFNNNSGGASYSLANRFDAVGSTSEPNTVYKEGTGYPALVPFSINYSFYRDNCGKQGSITTFGLCPSGGNVVDTNNNAADFIFVDTNGTSAGAGQRLGAPGPENLSSPIERNATVLATLLDPCVGGASPPNRVRDFTSDPANNSTFGTLDIRRTFSNNTGSSVTRLRFRVVDITTFPAPSGIADLRPRTSTSVVVTVDRPPCGSGTSNVTVEGTTLEQPPSQPNGGGFNSSLSAGIVTLATPLANGATVDLRFLLGIQQTGSFKFFVNVEALP